MDPPPPPTEGHAYLKAVGLILLHLFKSCIVICAIRSKPVRVGACALIALSCLLGTPDAYRDYGRSLNVHVAGLAATVAMCIVAHSLRYPDGTCPPLKEVANHCFQYVYQHTPTRPPPPPPTSSDKQQPGQDDASSSDDDEQPPEFSRGAAARSVLDKLLQSCLLYAVYDIIMTTVKQYPHAELTKRDPLFRAAHSYAFGIALYLTFQIALVPLLALTWVLHPAGQRNAVRTFDRPWLATSLAELWGRRWHQMFRSSFIHLAYRPTRTALHALSTRLKSTHPSAKPPAALALAERALPLLATFALSGVVHEYMCWGGLGQASGLQMLFFLVHACLIFAEQAVCWAAPRAVASVPAWVKQAALHVVFLVTSPLFNEPWLKADYHIGFWHPWSLAAPLLTAMGVLQRA